MANSSHKSTQDILIYIGIFIFFALIVWGAFMAIVNKPDPVTTSSVHWHSRISYEACGNEVEFQDDKTHGTIHGHNDGMAHVEGVVLDEEEITLAAFFKNAGIDITGQNFADYQNGDKCNFSSGHGKVVFYVNDEPFSDPNKILLSDNQEIRVVFE